MEEKDVDIPDKSAVRTTHWFLRSNDDGTPDISFAHFDCVAEKKLVNGNIIIKKKRHLFAVVAGTGLALFMTTTISSPTLAKPSLTLCLRTLTHSAMSAPVLSITC